MSQPPTTPPTTGGEGSVTPSPSHASAPSTGPSAPSLSAAATPPYPGLITWVVLTLGAAWCLTPWASPGIALAVGVAMALAGLVHPPAWAKPASRWIIQICVVLMGFRLNLRQLADAGGTGLLFAAATIVGTFALGWIIGRLLKLDRVISTLLSAGTAICGGSAIAAVGSAIRAPAAAMSVAIGVVFLLNAAAIYIFPPIGRELGLSPEQYGYWVAIAVHDVSSVVASAQAFGDVTGQAETTATAVKLARTIWIAPVALAARWAFTRGTIGTRGSLGPPVPWFIIAFVAASAIRTRWPQIAPFADGTLKLAAIAGMSAALLLIGLSLTRKTLAAVGWRAFVLGLALWVAISAAALAAARSL